jgi:hypothetical protein
MLMVAMLGRPPNISVVERVRGTYDKNQAETILHCPSDTVSIPFESILFIDSFSFYECFFH